VRAAADGDVVYSGSGLIGYGQLIILKHNDTYLSAYGHNQTLRVAEGERVTSGEVIALMGRGPGDRPLLHFEIRLEGKPVDPVRYLPAR
jgi:lipoprotein NlpD